MLLLSDIMWLTLLAGVAGYLGLLAFSIIAILALVNLRGVGDSSRLEIITVWGKLFVLLGLSIFGIIHWNPEQTDSWN